MFNMNAITNRNNKVDDKSWPYRMLIIGPSGSGKTNALLNLITTTTLSTRFIFMLKI